MNSSLDFKLTTTCWCKFMQVVFCCCCFFSPVFLLFVRVTVCEHVDCIETCTELGFSPLSASLCVTHPCEVVVSALEP